ncbi:hypothetical protein A4X20_22540 [Mycolicibacterium iranicum]|uniref:FAD-binding domain-containing protein n=1 Tax=Mycolicibacterium iranicum TaxID=912594 RepID=A0A178LV04_MYCIR|nr:hypothetical protein A4X20_22540 [Mycolicibacterium iranicum]
MVLRADYLVGCDGGRSLVRKAAGIDFPRWEPTTSYLIAEVEFASQPGRAPEWGIRRDARGVHALSNDDGGPVRVMVAEQRVHRSGEPDFAVLSAALIAVYGTDYEIYGPTSISRFTDTARQTAAYRRGRTLHVGDATHVHHPIGGQGSNTGLQDAVNLGWILAQVVRGTSTDRLLDTYHDERHPIGACVLHNAPAQLALLGQDDRTKALYNTTADLLAMEEPLMRVAAMTAGLDIHYSFGDGHLELGRRMPDLDLVTARGPHPDVRPPAGTPALADRFRCGSEPLGLGRSGASGRGRHRRDMGAAGAGRGRGCCGVGQTRRIRRVGGRPLRRRRSPSAD